MMGASVLKDETVEEINDILDDLSPLECRALKKLTLLELIRLKQSLENLRTRLTTERQRAPGE